MAAGNREEKGGCFKMETEWEELTLDEEEGRELNVLWFLNEAGA